MPAPEPSFRKGNGQRRALLLCFATDAHTRCQARLSRHGPQLHWCESRGRITLCQRRTEQLVRQFPNVSKSQGFTADDERLFDCMLRVDKAGLVSRHTNAFWYAVCEAYNMEMSAEDHKTWDALRKQATRHGLFEMLPPPSE
jgi:hypothetical protein